MKPIIFAIFFLQCQRWHKKVFSNENFWDFKDLARGGSAAVEYLTLNLKFKGLNPACCIGRDIDSGRENGKNVQNYVTQ